MTSRGIDIKHPKLRGEWAELRFMARASEFDLRVTKPWGDSSDYDFAVEHDGLFLRVQVKSTRAKQRRCPASYVCDLRRGGRLYTCDQVDFFAIYVVPRDVWYILPAAVAVGMSSNLTLSPDKADSKHGPYKEAWHLLCGGTAEPHAADIPASTTNDGVCANEEADCCQPEDDESPDDAPPSLIESRLRAIKWNPVLTHWKPRK